MTSIFLHVALKMQASCNCTLVVEVVPTAHISRPVNAASATTVDHVQPGAVHHMRLPAAVRLVPARELQTGQRGIMCHFSSRGVINFDREHTA